MFSCQTPHPCLSKAWVKAKAKYTKDLEDFKAAGGVILKPEKTTRTKRAARRAAMVGDGRAPSGMGDGKFSNPKNEGTKIMKFFWRCEISQHLGISV